jgi:hypothetical protein
VVAHVERSRCVLLNHEDSRARRANLGDDLERALDDVRREAERGLIEQDELRPRHQRAADCKHLLLAPRQRSARLQSPLRQAWKLFKDACLLPSTPPLALISSAAIFAPLAT